MKLLISLMLLLTGFGSWAEDPSAQIGMGNKKPYKSKPAEARKAMEAGKYAVSEKMKDPSSVMFRKLFIRNDIFLCGEVNSKNSFGGYVGYKKFIAMGEVGLVEFDDESLDFTRRWARDCEGAQLTEIEQILLGR